MGLPFDQLKKALKSFDVDEQTKEIVSETSGDITDLNTADQLFIDGINTDGDKLKAYSNPYKNYKRRINQPSDRTTLKLTGDFHKSFKVKTTSKDFTVFATDKKTKKLTAKYGKKIFGLTLDNQSLYSEIVLVPNIVKNFRKSLNLKK
ncbi:hypothetical protein OAD61_00725 [bacterium]|nr:hypothetical protein [bacterium]